MNMRAQLDTHSCIGIFSKTVDSAVVEAAGLAGLDFIILDTEHGPSGAETLNHHIRAAALTGMASIVRVSGVDTNEIGSALDAGADGVQIPNIASATQAAEAIRAARFHPAGSRGVCRFVRAASYGRVNKSDYFERENRKLVVLQVEGMEGVRNLDEILALSGFDVLFIGPYDLSQSVGVPGEIDSPKVLSIMKTIAEKADRRQVLLGTFSESPEQNQALASAGYRYLACSVDLNIFMSAIEKLVEASKVTPVKERTI